MKYKIDVVRIRENSIQLNGWVVGKTPESKAAFLVLDENRKKVKTKYVSTRRDDVSQIYYKKIYDRDFGFDIQFPYERGKTYWLLIRCDGRISKMKFNEELIAKRSSVAYKRMEKIRDLMNMETVHVALEFGKKHGLKALFLKSKHKLQGIDNDYEYAEWYDLTKPTEEELKRQRSERWEDGAKFSIVMPVYRAPVEYLKVMLDSILTQTYTNWELCIADGSPNGDASESVIKTYIEKDEAILKESGKYTGDGRGRIHYMRLEKNGGFSDNTNAAVSMAAGEWIVLADQDDAMPEHALYECAKVIREYPECDVIYSDEDKMDMDGGALFDPHFKPDFNPDLLCSVNYICHQFVVKKELFDRVGGFRKEFDGAQDYDLILRCTEEAKEIRHIPKVLYHWRCHQGSTASNPQSKLYAFEAGSRAVMEHYARRGIETEKVEKGIDYGIYHTTFKIQGSPLVSVIIPNKDHRGDLDLCVRSILTKCSYKNLEFVVVENNSKEPETFEYYEKIQKEFPQVHVVKWEREFNYSAINNFGVKHAAGQYLLFLNNDIEPIAENFIEEMLGFCQREDVGAVGARLLYPDDTIQHAGVVVGFGGIAGHTFIGLHQAENSYFHRAMCAQDYSAVTAACMMSKKSVFEAVGGFSEGLAVAFNDIDYCMKVRNLDKLVVYAPYAVLYHYESKSRGLEDTPEKVARFNREVAKFAKKWPDMLRDGDPYYNPNLTLRKSNFALRDLLKEGIGEPYPLDPAIQKLMEE